MKFELWFQGTLAHVKWIAGYCWRQKPTFGTHPEALEGQTAVEINLSEKINGHFLFCGAASQRHRIPAPSITAQPDAEPQANLQQLLDREIGRLGILLLLIWPHFCCFIFLFFVFLILKKRTGLHGFISFFLHATLCAHDQDANCYVSQDAGLGEVQGRRRVAEVPGGLIGSPSVSGTEQMSEYTEPLPPCFLVPLLVPFVCVCWKFASAHWHSVFLCVSYCMWLRWTQVPQELTVLHMVWVTAGEDCVVMKAGLFISLSEDKRPVRVQKVTFLPMLINNRQYLLKQTWNLHDCC